MFLLGLFGGIAAVLAAVGIYGVMANIVAQRTREIGIRIALGARAREVLSLVVRQALALISVGLVLGLAGSFGLTRILASALWGVTATDPRLSPEFPSSSHLWRWPRVSYPPGRPPR